MMRRGFQFACTLAQGLPIMAIELLKGRLNWLTATESKRLTYQARALVWRLGRLSYDELIAEVSQHQLSARPREAQACIVAKLIEALWPTEVSGKIVVTVGGSRLQVAVLKRWWSIKSKPVDLEGSLLRLAREFNRLEPRRLTLVGHRSGRITPS
jgi:hypothetical protein